MLNLLKAVCVSLYALGMIAGGPLLMVWTGFQLSALLGDSWWAGLLIAPVLLAEFVAFMSLLLWEDNPVTNWLD